MVSGNEEEREVGTYVVTGSPFAGTTEQHHLVLFRYAAGATATCRTRNARSATQPSSGIGPHVQGTGLHRRHLRRGTFRYRLRRGESRQSSSAELLRQFEQVESFGGDQVYLPPPAAVTKLSSARQLDDATFPPC